MRIRLIALFSLMLSLPAGACTLWGAAGLAAGGGTLLAKNRDWRPDHVQSIRLIHPRRGASYVGLFADNGSAPGLKAGVNEYGLSVVSASASSLAKQYWDSPDVHGPMLLILREDHSIDDVLAKAAQRFSHSSPMFLLISDHQQLLEVEIGKDGRYTLHSQQEGVLAHTNHYLSDELADCNHRIGDSSQMRLARIRTLLASGPSYSLSDFARFSQDQNAGQNNSLWRQGKEHTLASWQIATPSSGAAQLSLRLANPGQTMVQKQWRLDAAFWQGIEHTLMPESTLSD
jgi:isopenicillin-N N-acyltransferase like protein